jgi:hypothetical protein
MGLVAAGPQFQALMAASPPSPVVPTKRVLPVWTGSGKVHWPLQSRRFPRRLLGFPTTVTSPVWRANGHARQYLEACVRQALGKAALTSACEAEVMVLGDGGFSRALKVAANIISETLALTA